ncbi:MAG TPA: prepilin-type N-terminal cleavage/methylation domain-containing protein [Verrucomicrobiae bacterium]|jgi:prepilin-type N-terminal cleavage/methylation domain-containing protein/prepilin-type processing-associated H-X9-DG protein
MNVESSKWSNRDRTEPNKGFTLVELLVTIAIVAALGAILLPALSSAKSQGQNAVCKNHLSQIGRAMEMYTADYNIYPSAMGGGGPPLKTWEDQLAPYNPLSWTNLSWHCPTYIANGGIVQWQPPPPEGGKFAAWTSYSYNAFGLSDLKVSGPSLVRKGALLGLGDLNLTVRDHQVVAPSEMYAIADARPILDKNAGGFVGRERMNPWRSLFGIGMITTEAEPPHSKGYNMLFADTHVTLVKRKDYLYPPRSAHNWNRDNQPHPELWDPLSEWAVQK